MPIITPGVGPIGAASYSTDADITAIAALTATRGNFIVGNSSAAWSEFAVGAAGTMLIGGTDPAWSAAGILSTSLRTPLVIGGTTTTSPLTFKTTTGVGTTGADFIFQVGNNGATEAARILNSGFLGIGTATPRSALTLAPAKSFAIDNLYTDASNGEWATLNWASNIFHIGATKNGTGIARVMSLDYADGVSAISIPAATGAVTFGGSITSGGQVTAANTWAFVFATRGRIDPTADGVFTLYDTAATSFGRLNFGGTTSSFPALKRSTTTLQVRLADDSADAGFKAASITTSATDFMHITTGTLANAAAAQAGTLLNAPVAGNPTKWLAISDNGTTRYIPSWS